MWVKVFRVQGSRLWLTNVPAFNMGFTPVDNKKVGLYAIVVRALQDGSTPSKDIDSQSTPVLDADDMMTYQWKPSSSDKATLTNAIWKSTSPETLDNTTSYTNTVSMSLGANVGFFGKEKTGGESVQLKAFSMRFGD